MNSENPNKKPSSNDKNISLVVQVCRYIEQQEHIPSLTEAAGQVNLSPGHLQRLFQQTLGISPRKYADAKRLKKFKEAVKQGEPITQALYEAGFGSSSRIYEFTHQYLGMTPRQYKTGGAAQAISYQIVNTPLGKLLIAITQKGICSMHFGSSGKNLKEALLKEFPHALKMTHHPQLTEWTQALINYLAGKNPWPLLPYDVKATAFQRKVWDFLRTIPPGQTYHYHEVAKAIGHPKASRAVGHACAVNQVALVIPCHRIVPVSGVPGHYRWGVERKKRILLCEQINR
ncbi:MAG: methylated-DNA--[protein]-cysteine S-methyltransferase [Candidatus Omnitrophica bacterium]|nr:methylated-DNA--[protein]-cysteine S-methyltransferase [Candidatus Omnitrophota bacterium]